MKYNAKAYDRFQLTVKKGERDAIALAIKKTGQSRNAFILEAIREKLEREGVYLEIP